jgi:hypothetical protein
MEKDLTSSLRNALTYPSSLKMTAVMPGEWAAEVVTSVEAVASTTEEVTKDAEVAAATEAVEVAVATTTTPAEATVVVAVATRPEVVAETEEAAVAVVATTIAATEAVTIEATKEILAVALITAHPAGVDLKHLLRETSTPTITTTTIKACPAATEDLEVLLSSLVEVETEVAASPTVEEAEEMVATVADMAVRLLTPVASTLPSRVSPTTLPLPTKTMAVASREEELPVDLPHPEDRAASTNRSLPIPATRNPKPAVESPAPFTSETSTRTPLTLLSPNSSANRTLRSR